MKRLTEAVADNEHRASWFTWRQAARQPHSTRHPSTQWSTCNVQIGIEIVTEQHRDHREAQRPTSRHIWEG